jgi:hypothetical protein
MLVGSMSAIADDQSLAEKARALIAEYSVEIQDRGIIFHTDFDPDLRFLARPEEADATRQEIPGTRERALRALLRFVMATVPDGCEVYFAMARPSAPVSVIGTGELTLRWQVAGDRRSQNESGVTSLRPRLGNAQEQIVGKPARALRADFKAAGWRLTLEAIRGGEEIWLRAEVC